MYLEFCGKKITGVLSVLPEFESRFEDEVIDPNSSKARRLKKIIGFGTRRRAKSTTTLSDMLLYGINYLVDHDLLVTEDIGAIVVSTLSQDYFLPQISSILHGKLGLSNEVACFDIMQACAGYTMGLTQSLMLLEHMEKGKKVLLCTGEIFNRRISDENIRSEEPSFGGDVANITIVENDGSEKIYGSIYNDGTKRENLIICEGGFKNPISMEKFEHRYSNTPFLNVKMNGSEVFNFVQKEIPPAIKCLTQKAGVRLQDVDYFLFHQPNKFMLQKLAEQLEIPFSKMPMDITESLGNSDSGTIPVAMTTDVAQQLKEKDNLCCLSGFGGGLTWASLIMKISRLDFCENVVSDL